MGAQDYVQLTPEQIQQQTMEMDAHYARQAAISGDSSKMKWFMSKYGLPQSEFNTHFSQERLQNEIDANKSRAEGSGGIAGFMDDLAGTAKYLAPAALAFMGGEAFMGMGAGEAATAGAGELGADTFAGQPIGMSTAGGVADTGFGAGTVPAGTEAGGASVAGGAADSSTLLDYAHQTVTAPSSGMGGSVMGSAGAQTIGGVDLSTTGLGANVGYGTTGAGFGPGSLMGDAATGSGISAGVSGATDLSLPFGLTGTDLMKGAGSFLTQQYMANRAQQQAQQAARLSNPLDQPQRAPFQNLAVNAAQNPLNNPFASQYLKMGQNMLDAGAAKSGNTANIAAGVIPQVMTGMSQDYNTWLNSLMAGGGFTQGPGYAGTNYASLAGQGLGYQNQAMYGLGDIAKKVFGTPQQPQQQAANAITGSSIEMGG